MEKLFEILGYQKLVEVVKHRKEYHTEINNQRVAVAIDEIKNGGWFLEIEVNCSEENIARDTINNLRKELKTGEITDLPYRDIVLQNIKNNKNS